MKVLELLILCYVIGTFSMKKQNKNDLKDLKTLTQSELKIIDKLYNERNQRSLSLSSG